tara:strand:+ start:1658 stop:2098 length:441 start_codon:yes stop_codon:yes gene_type:complete
MTQTRSASPTKRPAPIQDEDQDGNHRPRKRASERRNRNEQVFQNTLASFSDFAPHILEPLTRQLQQQQAEQSTSLQHYFDSLADYVATSYKALLSTSTAQLGLMQTTAAQHQASTKHNFKQLEEVMLANNETLFKSVEANAALRYS